jgi:hypothetical protein
MVSRLEAAPEARGDAGLDSRLRVICDVDESAIGVMGEREEVYV